MEKEFRIGNRIDFKVVSPEEGVIKCSNGAVTDIYKGDVYINEIRIPEIDMLCLIPLTEEWLLKFGFDRGSDIIGECYFIEGKTEFVIYIGDDYYRYYEHGTKIKYVHQLQNLYFALTGEELELK